jgi:rubredoxin
MNERFKPNCWLKPGFSQLCVNSISKRSVLSHVIIFSRDFRILALLPIESEAMSTEAAEPQVLDRYECSACGYIYEPQKGDDRSQVAAGTLFTELPANWRCPVCTAAKSRFQNIGEVGSPSGFKENLKYGFGGNSLTPGQKNVLIFGSLALAFLFFLSLYGLE